MLDKSCPDVNRLWAEYSEEVYRKTFRLEERLSHAKLYQDDGQVKALTHGWHLWRKSKHD
jgi:hypothetical protein